MPSNFECVGFDVASEQGLFELVQELLPKSEHLGRGPRGFDVYRWQDVSGARLVFDLKRDVVHNVLPSFAGESSVSVRFVRRLNDDTSSAEIVDETGGSTVETVTRLAVDIEERALLPSASVRGSASLVGLVGEVAVFADADEFLASPASVLGDPEDAGPPPPHVLEQGWPWPPRIGAQAFVSHGLFAPAREARPIATLNGVVSEADERVNSLSGITFVRSHVRSAGFAADVCWRANEMTVPVPGNVVAATVYMVGSLHDWALEPSETPRLLQALGSRLRRRRN
jgi:hypothetical protein